MAVNPLYGPILQKEMDDQNGPAGTTSGGVRDRTATTEPVQPYRDPTPGQPPGQPPNPYLNPLDEAFVPNPSAVGPGEG